MHSVLDKSSALAKQIVAESGIDDADIEAIIEQLSRAEDDRAIDRVIKLLKHNIAKLEQAMWQQSPSDEAIEQYQGNFRTLEKLYPLKSHDQRYRFRIVIPVADRPQHLKQCLDSLLRLCRCYEYGGRHDGSYARITVLVADDSSEAANIEAHRKTCDTFTRLGLTTEYFGLDDQREQLATLNTSAQPLENIIPDPDTLEKTSDFAHKGASIMRNITYLKLQRELASSSSADGTLIYFIDSDQEFCINIAGTDTDKKHFAVNYFYYLNEIFSRGEVSVLTGKVVGDPPVSPAVMAANFQQDIRTFLSTSARLDPENPCQFHQQRTVMGDDASYHDMARLFGFSSHEKQFHYHCSLQGEHSNADCFADFSEKLSHFFYGEHPTRKTFFSFADGFSKITPARTVYTGNYVIKPEALKHFIPFATLKLRMAGPVLGRLLKSEIKHRFVSANLPMLHNRTVETTGASEFRPGVDRHNDHVDLGNEFIRQFYGDVMLFTMERITADGYPDRAIDRDVLQQVLARTYHEIMSSYQEKHDAIMTLRREIRQQFDAGDSWWNRQRYSSGDSRSHIESFLHNIDRNFSESADAYQQITASEHVDKHLGEILSVILQYHDDRQHWFTILNDLSADTSHR